jgi:hypothetical protein
MPLPVSRARKSSLPTSVTTGPLRAPERCCRRRDGPKLRCYFPLPGELHPQAPFPPKLPTPKRPPILLELQSTTRVVADHHGSPPPLSHTATRATSSLTHYKVSPWSSSPCPTSSSKHPGAAATAYAPPRWLVGRRWPRHHSGLGSGDRPGGARAPRCRLDWPGHFGLWARSLLRGLGPNKAHNCSFFS